MSTNSINKNGKEKEKEYPLEKELLRRYTHYGAERVVDRFWGCSRLRKVLQPAGVATRTEKRQINDAIKQDLTF